MPDTNSLEAADIALGVSASSQRRNPLVRAAAEIGKLGDQGPLYAVAAAWLIAGFVFGHSRWKRAALSMLAAVAAADAGKRLTKRLVRRTRPHVLLDEGRYESEPGGSPRKPEQSFPSGNVAGTVAAGRAVCRHYPGASPWTTAAGAVIALARLAKGAHWPLDVAAGWVIGVAAEALSRTVLRKLISAAPAALRAHLVSMKRGWCRTGGPAGRCRRWRQGYGNGISARKQIHPA